MHELRCGGGHPRVKPPGPLVPTQSRSTAAWQIGYNLGPWHPQLGFGLLPAPLVLWHLVPRAAVPSSVEWRSRWQCHHCCRSAEMTGCTRASAYHTCPPKLQFWYLLWVPQDVYMERVGSSVRRSSETCPLLWESTVQWRPRGPDIKVHARRASTVTAPTLQKDFLVLKYKREQTA